MPLENIKKHKETLKQLAKCKKHHCHYHIIANASDELLDCLCECAFNVLKGNIALTESQHLKLKKHKHKLRELTWGKTRKNRKKEILQEGGFLPSLLVPLISSLFALL